MPTIRPRLPCEKLGLCGRYEWRPSRNFELDRLASAVLLGQLAETAESLPAVLGVVHASDLPAVDHEAAFAPWGNVDDVPAAARVCDELLNGGALADREIRVRCPGRACAGRTFRWKRGPWQFSQTRGRRSFSTVPTALTRLSRPVLSVRVARRPSAPRPSWNDRFSRVSPQGSIQSNSGVRYGANASCLRWL